MLSNDKRVEAQLRKNMAEHQHMLSSHNTEMQTLRDSIKYALEKFDSLFQKSETDLKEKTDSINDFISKLQEKVRAHEMIYSDQKKTLQSLFQEFQNFLDISFTKKQAEKLQDNINLQIKACDISHINSFQTYQMEMKSLVNSLKNDLIKLKSETDQRLTQLNEKIESKFYISLMDKEAVLKEVRIYQKSIFIIEKKLENIYTLIDRINKKGEVCHKPV